MSPLDALFAIGAWTLVFAGATVLLLEVRSWIRARALGLDLHIVEIAGLRLRGLRPLDVLEPLARARGAGLEVELGQLEAHAHAGGDAGRVVDMLLRARDDGRDLSFAHAAARELRGDLLPVDPSAEAAAPDNFRIESQTLESQTLDSQTLDSQSLDSQSHPPTHTRGSS